MIASAAQGDVVLFRPEMNATRFARSAERLAAGDTEAVVYPGRRRIGESRQGLCWRRKVR